MECSRCGSAAIISQRYCNVHLCTRHFEEDFEQRVRAALCNGLMVEEGDRIAVALSGGKDSSALLHVLYKVLADKNVELLAITVDEGISGYRDDTLRSARKIAGKLRIQQEIVSFRQEYGFELDDVIQKDLMPCTICGVFRKNALNRAAKRLSATKLATGHNLDDEGQSIMMNYLKGDLQRLIRLKPERAQPGLIPRIKPLREIPEKEVALYCIAQGLYEESVECPYASLSCRSDVRDMINRAESQVPGTKQSILKGFESIVKLTAGRRLQIPLSSCSICGEPCTQDICQACKLLDRLRGTKLKG